MAASEESCDGNPDFAVICSFITKFGNECGVNVTIPDLQQMLEDTKNAIHEDLAELHIHLLRRGRKRVTKEKWEKSLIKFCHEYSSVDAWELERFGYKKAKLSVKLELLKRLLELQFDSNAKFKSEVNKHEAESLRIPPVGRDIDGQLYWYQLDKEYNMRLYRQGPEEESTWQLLCSNTDHLRNLLSNLQKNITKGLSLEALSKISSDDTDSKTLKMETDGDDLTSRISETKPTTIIIKTEKKEITTNVTVTDSVKPLEKDDGVTLLEQEKHLPNKKLPSDKEVKSEKDQDGKKDTTEVTVKKESTPEEVTPMDVDDCKLDKSSDEKVLSVISKSDVEMEDVEKVIENKTQGLSTDKGLSKNSPIVKASAETNLTNQENSTLKSTIPLVEQTSSEDLSIEHSPCKTVPSTTKNNSSKDNTSGDNLPSDFTSSSKEHVEEKYKGGKIKLYEKWSNEKKLATAALSSPNSKQNLKGLDPPSANEKAVDHKESPGGNLSKSKSPNLPPQEEVPMDLSVCVRSDDAVSKNMPEDLPNDLTIGKKRPISEQIKTNQDKVEQRSLKVCPENSAKSSNVTSEAPRPFKKKHLSKAMEESKETSDLNRKSVIFEVKNSKLLNQFQGRQHSSDSMMKDKLPENSGLSHLQALQNMCNENPMTCFQSSVIQSASPDKRLKTDSLPKLSLNSAEKSSYNEATCDNISQKYKFNNSQLSGDVKHYSETDVPTPLLKSNVHSSSETIHKELTSPQQKPISDFKSLIPEVQEHTPNSSKTFKKSSSESGLPEKQCKDIHSPENFQIDQSTSQAPKAVSEKSTSKKHSRNIDHSVASIIEKDCKTGAQTSLKERDINNCDNHLINVAQTNTFLNIANQDNVDRTENSLNCSDTKSNVTVVNEMCSSKTDTKQPTSDHAKTTTKESDKSISSITSKTNLDVCKTDLIQKPSVKDTTSSESKVPTDIELKRDRIADTEVVDVSCNLNKTKSGEECSVQSNTNNTKDIKVSLDTESTKVNDSKLQSCLTDKTYKVEVNKPIDCDKSEKNEHDSMSSEYASDIDTKKTASIIKESKNSNSLSEDISSFSSQENSSFDNSNMSVSSSNEKSASSISCTDVSAKESKKSNKLAESTITEEKNVPPVSIEVNDNKTLKEKSEHPIEAQSIKENSDLCKELDTNIKSNLSDSSKNNSSSEKDATRKASSLLPDAIDSADPSTKSEHLEKKANDINSEISSINKTDHTNNLNSVDELEPKREAKGINGNLQSETLMVEKDEKIELSSKDKMPMLTKDQSDKTKLDKLAGDVVSENKDSVSVSKPLAKVDIEESKLEDLSKDKSNDLDSTIKDLSPCGIKDLNEKLEKEMSATSDKVEDAPISEKENSVTELTEASETIDCKQSTQDTNSESKKKDSTNLIKTSCEKSETTTTQDIKGKTSSVSEKRAELMDSEVSFSKHKSKKNENLESKDKKDSANLIPTSCNESETPTVEVTKGKTPLVSKEGAELMDSKSSLGKHKSKKSKSNKDVSEENADMVTECSNEDKDKKQEAASKSKESKSKKFPKVKEAVDKESASLITKSSEETNEKIETPKKPDDKLEESSEVTSKHSVVGEEKDFVKTPKGSKSKKSKSKLKDQEDDCQKEESDSTSPKNLKQLNKDSADHPISPIKDKKSKDVESSPNKKSLENDCANSLTEEKGKDTSIPPVSKDLLEKLETKSKGSTKAKSEGSLKTKLKINVKNPLGRYFMMQSSCLESKMRHPSFEKSKQIPPPAIVAKPKLITTFSMDTTDEVRIIHSVSDASPNKKKRGRLRQQTTPSDPSPKKATPTKASLKASPKSSKKAVASEEKEGFNIPEGFLEILSNAQSEGSSSKKETRRKSRGRKLQISAPSLENSESESAPIKRSRRIQDIQQKKMSELAVEMEREQRIFEQMAKKSVKKGAPLKSPIKAVETKSPRGPKKFQPPTPEETCMESKRTPRKMNSRSRNMTKMHLLYEDESKDSEFSTSRETEKSKKRRKGRSGNGKKGYKPWDVSSESESTLEELTEEEEEEHEEPLVFEVNEDEFACEEVDENAEVIVVRRARTAKKIPEDANIEETVVADDKPCSKCGKYDKPEWILLCDKCDNGYHTTCLIPPLMIIPEGDWYCQPCEHIFLCEWIQKELHKLEVVLKQREREELRKQRLAYVGISLDNVLKPEKKEESDEGEEEDNKDEEDDSEEEVKERKPVKSRRRDDSSSEEERQNKLYGKRSVRARRTVNYQFKEYDELIASAIGDEILGVKLEGEATEVKEFDDDEENDSDKAFQAKFPQRKKRKTTRLNDLDASDDDDSGEEYKGSSGSDSEQTAPPSNSGSESAGSGEWKIVKTKGKKPKRKTRRGRRDDSDEDWDDEENQSDGYRPVTRRAKQKSISYREISSDDEWDPKPKAVKKRKKSFSSEDSEASYKKKKPKTVAAKKKKRVRKWASSDSSEESERSINFSESSGSEDKWKVKKSSTSSQVKVNINKKVLSSDENESSQESAPKKKPNKIVSEEEESEDGDEENEEEEEESSEEEEGEDDDDEEEEEDDVKTSKPVKKVEKSEVNTTKTEAKVTKSEVKTTNSEVTVAKPEVTATKLEVKDPKLETKQMTMIDKTKAADVFIDVKEDSSNSEPPVEPIREKIVVSTVQDKPPQRTVKKDATKMVPCVIPYDKSPKSGHGATADEESDKEMAKERENIQNTPKPVPYKSALQQHPLKSVPKLHSGVVASATTPPKPIVNKTIPVLERRPFTSSIVQPFSNLEEDVESDDEVPLERIPTAVPNPIPNKPLPYERESKYTPAKELPGFSYTAPEEKCFPPTYTHMAPFQDYSSRPSPLKPSLVETYNRSSPSKLTPLDTYNRSSPSKLTPLDSYPGSTKGAYPLKPTRVETYDRSSPSKLTSLDSYNRASPSKLTSLDSYPASSKGAYPLKPTLVETYNRSSPSKLTPLDSYSRSSSPKGFISLDSYSKKKQHFYGNPDQEPRPPIDTYQREIGFPPEPTQFPPSPNVQRDPDTPPRFHSQYPDSYGPPRSPEYYHQNSQYYQGGEPGRSRPAYQPNYGPLNPYVATPVPQPNGGFMIDTLLRARNPEDGEDELTGVTDIVSYITQE